MWVDRCEVGVAFEAITTLADPSSNDAEYSARFALLEAEIAALKQVLQRLQRKIEKVEVA